MVLEAWYYTRAAGTDLVHWATTGSISTAARGIDIQGVVINYWGAWVTAATGILVYWYTGILVYFLGTKRGLNFHFILLLLSYFVYNWCRD